MQGDSSSGAVRVRCLAQGHLNTHLGGSRDQTCNLPVASQPSLPRVDWLLKNEREKGEVRGWTVNKENDH